MLTCPKCNLISPDTAGLCDCGYSFTAGLGGTTTNIADETSRSSKPQKAKVQKRSFLEQLQELLTSAGGLLILAAIGLPIYQLAQYLKTGDWPEYPLLYGIELLPKNSELRSWLLYPDSWYGLHEIISWILIKTPISALCFFVGIFIIFLSESLVSSFRSQER